MRCQCKFCRARRSATKRNRFCLLVAFCGAWMVCLAVAKYVDDPYLAFLIGLVIAQCWWFLTERLTFRWRIDPIMRIADALGQKSMDGRG